MSHIIPFLLAAPTPQDAETAVESAESFFQFFGSSFTSSPGLIAGCACVVAGAALMCVAIRLGRKNKKQGGEK